MGIGDCRCENPGTSKARETQPGHILVQCVIPAALCLCGKHLLIPNRANIPEPDQVISQASRICAHERSLIVVAFVRRVVARMTGEKGIVRRRKIYLSIEHSLCDPQGEGSRTLRNIG